jgi:hypothetical protein
LDAAEEEEAAKAKADEAKLRDGADAPSEEAPREAVDKPPLR